MSLILRKVMKKSCWSGLLNILLAMLFASFTPAETLPLNVATPDVDTASDNYKRRFASRTGKWFLDEQASGLLSMLDRWESSSILDVGGGHGQYTEQLIKRGHSVTVMGSSAKANTQIRDLLRQGSCKYVVGNFSRFPFADKSVDIVISFRLMTHLENWEHFVGEASRVARNAVIVDFPITQSLNCTYPLLFKLKRRLEKNSTRPFTVFDEKRVLESFQHAGFSPTARHAQYFFPMVFHRVLHSTPMSINIEKICRSVALTDHFGSPVILRVEPNIERQEHRS